MKNQIQYLQKLFYDILNDFGRVYVVVKHSDNSQIGRRGFSEEEKQRGLVLVFNEKNYKALDWNEDGSIIANLGFGPDNKTENCFLHFDDIVTVFSPDGHIRFDRWDMLKSVGEKPSLVKEKKLSEELEHETPAVPKAENVISFKDFKKKKG